VRGSGSEFIFNIRFFMTVYTHLVWDNKRNMSCNGGEIVNKIGCKNSTDLKRNLILGSTVCVIIWIWANFIPFLGIMPVLFIGFPSVFSTFLVPCATSLKHEPNLNFMGKLARWFIFVLTLSVGLVGIATGVQEYVMDPQSI